MRPTLKTAWFLLLAAAPALIGAGAGVAISCATVKRDVAAIAHGVLNCTKAAAPELLAETVRLAIDLSDGHIDWQVWIDRAVDDASGVKACALAEYRAARAAAPALRAAAVTVAAPDPLVDGLARVQIALSVSQIVTSRGPL